MKQKLVTFLALMMAMTSIVGFSGCELFNDFFNSESSSMAETGKTLAFVESATETMVVIKVENAGNGVKLLQVMNELKEEGVLSFKMQNGMVVEINGTANDADYNPCWMLYTSDAERANTAWGTCEYQGNTIGSALVGAELLPVVDGGIYVWAYQEF